MATTSRMCSRVSRTPSTANDHRYGHGTKLGDAVPEQFRKLAAQPCFDMFEDEHGQNINCHLVDDVLYDSASWL
ncbi:MAG: hypothetical protein ACKPKO_11195, partial [Candidatus Fonsibacter sp.]